MADVVNLEAFLGPAALQATRHAIPAKPGSSALGSSSSLEQGSRLSLPAESSPPARAGTPDHSSSVPGPALPVRPAPPAEPVPQRQQLPGAHEAAAARASFTGSLPAAEASESQHAVGDFAQDVYPGDDAVLFQRMSKLAVRQRVWIPNPATQSCGPPAGVLQLFGEAAVADVVGREAARSSLRAPANQAKLQQMAQRLPPRLQQARSITCTPGSPASPFVQGEVAGFLQGGTVAVDVRVDGQADGVPELQRVHVFGGLVWPVNPDAAAGLPGPDNLVDLQYAHEPGVLATLRSRFHAGLPYTFAAGTLVAINPGRVLLDEAGESLHAPAYMARIRTRPTASEVELLPPEEQMNARVAPHVFCVADDAFRRLQRDALDQAVVPLGGPGSGKSEVLRQCLNYLCHLCAVDAAVFKVDLQEVAAALWAGKMAAPDLAQWAEFRPWQFDDAADEGRHNTRSGTIGGGGNAASGGIRGMSVQHRQGDLTSDDYGLVMSRARSSTLGVHSMQDSSLANSSIGKSLLCGGTAAGSRAAVAARRAAAPGSPTRDGAAGARRASALPTAGGMAAAAASSGGPARSRRMSSRMSMALFGNNRAHGAAGLASLLEHSESGEAFSAIAASAQRSGTVTGQRNRRRSSVAPQFAGRQPTAPATGMPALPGSTPAAPARRGISLLFAPSDSSDDEREEPRTTMLGGGSTARGAAALDRQDTIHRGNVDQHVMFEAFIPGSQHASRRASRPASAFGALPAGDESPTELNTAARQTRRRASLLRGDGDGPPRVAPLLQHSHELRVLALPPILSALAHARTPLSASSTRVTSLLRLYYRPGAAVGDPSTLMDYDVVPPASLAQPASLKPVDRSRIGLLRGARVDTVLLDKARVGQFVAYGQDVATDVVGALADVSMALLGAAAPGLAPALTAALPGTGFQEAGTHGSVFSQQYAELSGTAAAGAAARAAAGDTQARSEQLTWFRPGSLRMPLLLQALSNAVSDVAYASESGSVSAAAAAARGAALSALLAGAPEGNFAVFSAMLAGAAVATGMLGVPGEESDGLVLTTAGACPAQRGRAEPSDLLAEQSRILQRIPTHALTTAACAPRPVQLLFLMQLTLSAHAAAAAQRATPSATKAALSSVLQSWVLSRVSPRAHRFTKALPSAGAPGVAERAAAEVQQSSTALQSCLLDLYAAGHEASATAQADVPWRAFVNSLLDVGFTPEECVHIARVLAGITAVLDIEFAPSEQALGGLSPSAQAAPAWESLHGLSAMDERIGRGRAYTTSRPAASSGKAAELAKVVTLSRVLPSDGGLPAGCPHPDQFTEAAPELGAGCSEIAGRWIELGVLDEQAMARAIMRGAAVLPAGDVAVLSAMKGGQRFAAACKLLGVSPGALAGALTLKQPSGASAAAPGRAASRSRSSTVAASSASAQRRAAASEDRASAASPTATVLPVATAAHRRAQMASLLYARVFGYVVRRVNELLAPVSFEGPTEDGKVVASRVLGPLAEQRTAKAAAAGMALQQVERLAMRSVSLVDGGTLADNNAAISALCGNGHHELLVNYMRERLEEMFSRRCVHAAEAALRAEGVASTAAAAVSAQWYGPEMVLDALDRPSVGILPVMDEAAAFVRSSDEAIVRKISANQKRSLVAAGLSRLDSHMALTESRWIRRRAAAAPFMIRHSAGNVLYDFAGVLSAHRGECPAELSACLAGSAQAWVSALFTPSRPGALASAVEPHLVGDDDTFADARQAAADAQAAASSATPGASARGKRRGSIVAKPAGSAVRSTGREAAGQQYRLSLNALIAAAAGPRVQPAFIRCVAPNSQGIAGAWDDHHVLQEVRGAGLVPVMMPAHSGWVYHTLLPDFYHRFIITLPSRAARMATVARLPLAPAPDADYRVLCTELLGALAQAFPQQFAALGQGQVTLGPRRVFCRKEIISYLEALREMALSEMDTAALILQHHLYGWAVAAQYRRARWVATVLARLWRMQAIRKYFKRARGAAIIVQRAVRAWLVRKRFVALRLAVSKLKRAWAARHAAARWARARRTLRLLHAVALGHVIRAEVAVRRVAAEKIQAMARKFVERNREWWARVHAALLMQAAWRGYAWRCRHKPLICYVRRHVAAALALFRTVRLQSAVRGWQVRRQYLKMRGAAVLVQAWARARLWARAFQVLRAAAVCIQRSLRAYMCRRNWKQMAEAHAVAAGAWRQARVRGLELQALQQYRARLAQADRDDRRAIASRAHAKRAALDAGGLPGALALRRDTSGIPVLQAHAATDEVPHEHYIAMRSMVWDVDALGDTTGPYPAGWMTSVNALDARLREHGSRIVSLSSGSAHSVALSSDGVVFTWGWGERGQLGHGCTAVPEVWDVDLPLGRAAGATAKPPAELVASRTFSPARRAPPRATHHPATAAAAAASAVVSPGVANAMGWDEPVQPGHEPVTALHGGHESVGVVGAYSPDARAARATIMRALRTGGARVRFGDGLAVPTMVVGARWPSGTARPAPPLRDWGAPVGGAVRIVAIAAGAAHTMALDEHGRVFTWGDNRYGALGLGEHAPELLRTGPSGAVARSAVGEGTPGPSAAGARTFAASPREVRALANKHVTAIAAGPRHSVAVTKTGAVYCFGQGAACGVQMTAHDRQATRSVRQHAAEAHEQDFDTELLVKQRGYRADELTTPRAGGTPLPGTPGHELPLRAAARAGRVRPWRGRAAGDSSARGGQDSLATMRTTKLLRDKPAPFSQTTGQRRAPTDLPEYCTAAGDAVSLSSYVVLAPQVVQRMAELPNVWAPTRVQGLPPVKADGIAVGAGVTMAVAQNGSLWSWGPGLASPGQAVPEQAVTPCLPAPTPACVWPRAPGKKPSPAQAVLEVCLGAQHVLARTADGAVLVWGFANDAQCGMAASEPTYAILSHGSRRVEVGPDIVPQPTFLPGLAGEHHDPYVLSIGANARASYAVDSEGELYVWGHVTPAALPHGAEGLVQMCTTGVLVPSHERQAEHKPAAAAAEALSEPRAAPQLDDAEAGAEAEATAALAGLLSDTLAWSDVGHGPASQVAADRLAAEMLMPDVQALRDQDDALLAATRQAETAAAEAKARRASSASDADVVLVDGTHVLVHQPQAVRFGTARRHATSVSGVWGSIAVSAVLVGYTDYILRHESDFDDLADTGALGCDDVLQAGWALVSQDADLGLDVAVSAQQAEAAHVAMMSAMAEGRSTLPARAQARLSALERRAHEQTGAVHGYASPVQLPERLRSLDVSAEQRMYASGASPTPATTMRRAGAGPTRALLEGASDAGAAAGALIFSDASRARGGWDRYEDDAPAVAHALSISWSGADIAAWFPASPAVRAARAAFARRAVAQPGGAPKEDDAVTRGLLSEDGSFGVRSPSKALAVAMLEGTGSEELLQDQRLAGMVALFLDADGFVAASAQAAAILAARAARATVPSPPVHALVHKYGVQRAAEVLAAAARGTSEQFQLELLDERPSLAPAQQQLLVQLVCSCPPAGTCVAAGVAAFQPLAASALQVIVCPPEPGPAPPAQDEVITLAQHHAAQLSVLDLLHSKCATAAAVNSLALKLWARARVAARAQHLGGEPSAALQRVALCPRSLLPEVCPAEPAAAAPATALPPVVFSAEEAIGPNARRAAEPTQALPPTDLRAQDLIERAYVLRALFGVTTLLPQAVTACYRRVAWSSELPAGMAVDAVQLRAQHTEGLSDDAHMLLQGLVVGRAAARRAAHAAGEDAGPMSLLAAVAAGKVRAPVVVRAKGGAGVLGGIMDTFAVHAASARPGTLYGQASSDEDSEAEYGAGQQHELAATSQRDTWAPGGIVPTFGGAQPSASSAAGADDEAQEAGHGQDQPAAGAGDQSNGEEEFAAAVNEALEQARQRAREAAERVWAEAHDMPGPVVPGGNDPPYSVLSTAAPSRPPPSLLKQPGTPLQGGSAPSRPPPAAAAAAAPAAQPRPRLTLPRPLPGMDTESSIATPTRIPKPTPAVAEVASPATSPAQSAVASEHGGDSCSCSSAGNACSGHDSDEDAEVGMPRQPAMAPTPSKPSAWAQRAQSSAAGPGTWHRQRGRAREPMPWASGTPRSMASTAMPTDMHLPRRPAAAPSASSFVAASGLRSPELQRSGSYAARHAAKLRGAPVAEAKQPDPELDDAYQDEIDMLEAGWQSITPQPSPAPARQPRAWSGWL